jgi:hypothetical protein
MNRNIFLNKELCARASDCGRWTVKIIHATRKTLDTWEWFPDNSSGLF